MFDTIDNLQPLSVVGKALSLALLTSFAFSIPSLWTHRTWLSSHKRMLLHAVSASYATLWGGWVFGGLQLFFEANLTTLWWLVTLWALFLLTSLNAVAYGLGAKPLGFYLTASLTRFVVLVYYIVGFGLIKDPRTGVSFMIWTLPFVLALLLSTYWWGRKREVLVAKTVSERSVAAYWPVWILWILTGLILVNVAFMPIRLALQDLGYSSGWIYWIGILLGGMTLPLSMPIATLYALFAHPREVLVMFVWLVGGLGLYYITILFVRKR